MDVDTWAKLLEFCEPFKYSSNELTTSLHFNCRCLHVLNSYIHIFVAATARILAPPFHYRFGFKYWSSYVHQLMSFGFPLSSAIFIMGMLDVSARGTLFCRILSRDCCRASKKDNHVSVPTYLLPTQRHYIRTRRYVLDGETRHLSLNCVGLAPRYSPLKRLVNY